MGGLTRVSLLDVQNVSVRFGGIIALDAVSVAIEPGEICGLIGPNGAGKTTLFNVVSRITQPYEGRVLLKGENLLAVPAHGIAARGVGRTFQNLALFPTMSVLENTMVGAHSQGRAGFARAALRVGTRTEERRLGRDAEGLLVRLGLADLAHRRAAGLPFGTLKRIELARALASRPSLLLMDEPASGLTHGEADALAQDIRSLRDQLGLTVLLVEHHMAMVMAVSDRIVAMEFGRVIAEGSPEQVRNDPDVIAAYLGSDA